MRGATTANTTGQAIARPGIEDFSDIQDPQQRLQAWLQREYESDPQGTMQRLNSSNAGAQFKVENGQIQPTDSGFFLENAWWLIPAAVATGGVALAVSGGLAGATAAGTAGSAAAGGVPSVAGPVATGIGGATVPAGSALSGGAGGMGGGVMNALQKYSGIAGDIGQVASGAAAGSAQQRSSEAGARVSADQLNRRSQILASLLGGLNDASVTSPNPNVAARTPQVSGGLRPSAMLGDGKREALMALLKKPVDLPTAGAAENTLGGVGLAASLYGAATRR